MADLSDVLSLGNAVWVWAPASAQAPQTDVISMAPHPSFQPYKMAIDVLIIMPHRWHVLQHVLGASCCLGCSPGPLSGNLVFAAAS